MPPAPPVASSCDAVIADFWFFFVFFVGSRHLKLERKAEDFPTLINIQQIF